MWGRGEGGRGEGGKGREEGRGGRGEGEGGRGGRKGREEGEGGGRDGRMHSYMHNKYFNFEFSLTVQIFPRPPAVLVHPCPSQGSNDPDGTLGGVAGRSAPDPGSCPQQSCLQSKHHVMEQQYSQDTLVQGRPHAQARQDE